MSEEDRKVNEILEKNGRIKLARKVYELENRIKEVREKLINSKEYKMANEMGLTSKMSILIELLEILDKENIDG